mmetsp:Transcript_10250/g.29150  ORF Transcript_10250/g.29150 Transcript_10250/m.29150 type:complete len:420 (+) Transcript_10250:167-1426(+)
MTCGAIGIESPRPQQRAHGRHSAQHRPLWAAGAIAKVLRGSQRRHRGRRAGLHRRASSRRATLRRRREAVRWLGRRGEQPRHNNRSRIVKFGSAGGAGRRCIGPLAARCGVGRDLELAGACRLLATSCIAHRRRLRRGRVAALHARTLRLRCAARCFDWRHLSRLVRLLCRCIWPMRPAGRRCGVCANGVGFAACAGYVPHRKRSGRGARAGLRSATPRPHPAARVTSRNGLGRGERLLGAPAVRKARALGQALLLLAQPGVLSAADVPSVFHRQAQLFYALRLHSILDVAEQVVAQQQFPWRRLLQVGDQLPLAEAVHVRGAQQRMGGRCRLRLRPRPCPQGQLELVVQLHVLAQVRVRLHVLDDRVGGEDEGVVLPGDHDETLLQHRDTRADVDAATGFVRQPPDSIALLADDGADG